MVGKINIITTRRVQLSAYFESCKSSQMYYKDKHLCAGKIVTLRFQFIFIKFSSFQHDTQNFKNKEEWNRIELGTEEHKRGIIKPCTQLHPAPSTFPQLHPAPSTSTQLHPAPSTSTQLISTSTQLSATPSTLLESKCRT